MGGEWTTLVIEVPDEVAVQYEVVDRYPGDDNSGLQRVSTAGSDRDSLPDRPRRAV